MSEFIMKPKVDFCFKELMEEPEVRRGFISAVLGIRPEDIVNTTLLPTHLRKESQEEKLGIMIEIFPNELALRRARNWVLKIPGLVRQIRMAW